MSAHLGEIRSKRQSPSVPNLPERNDNDDNNRVLGCFVYSILHFCEQMDNSILASILRWRTVALRWPRRWTQHDRRPSPSRESLGIAEIRHERAPRLDFTVSLGSQVSEYCHRRYPGDNVLTLLFMILTWRTRDCWSRLFRSKPCQSVPGAHFNYDRLRKTYQLIPPPGCWAFYASDLWTVPRGRDRRTYLGSPET
jgi:hypothetical protein